MRKINILFLLVPAAGYAAAYTATQNGNWNSSATWGGAGIPGFGDTASIPQYTVTVPASVTANLGTVNTTSLVIGDGTHAAALVVDGELVLRGSGNLNGPFYDCTHPVAVSLGTGGTISLDENGKSSASGFVIPAGTAPCTRFVFGTAGDSCTWGTSSPTCPTNVRSINNSSANGVLLLDSGTSFGGSVTAWNGVQISNCGSSSVACYQAEMFQATGTAWSWKQISLVSDSWFGDPLGGSVPDSVSITVDSTIASGTRLNTTDFWSSGFCGHGSYSPGFTSACSGARSITNSLLRHMRPNGAPGGDPFTAGATVANVYFDDLASGDYLSLTSANVAGGSWSYVVAYSDVNTCGENTPSYTGLLAPVADHVYALCSGAGDPPIMISHPSNKNWGTNISLTNAIFDLETDGTGRAGHCYIYGNDGAPDNGYSVTMSYITVLRNAALGYGCGFTAWSSRCPAAPTASISHLLQPYAGYASQGADYFCEGPYTATAPALSSYKGNIYYDVSPQSNALVFGNLGTDMDASQPTNVVIPTEVDYNVNYNFLPFSVSRFTTGCAAGCTNGGGPYAVPMSGAVPGTHDLNIDPSLLDDTRNGYTWAVSRGQPGNAAGFKQIFINGGPSAIGTNISALFYYIDQGNIPARPLWNAMPDGTTIGPSQPVMFPRDMRTVTR